MQIDFAAIKAAVGVEKAARFLGLELHPDRDTFRAPCPVCKRAGERAIILTPAIQRWYCHGMCKKGGDSVYLVAHCRGIRQTEAGQLLQDAFLTEPEKPKGKAKKPPRRAKTASTPIQEQVADDYSIVDWMNLT